MRATKKKKLLMYLKIFLIRATKKNKQKKIAGKIFYYLLKKICFFYRKFGMFFYLPKLTGFFSNQQHSDARAGQKKTHVLFLGNALPKSNARAHLKQRKKT